MNPHLSISIVGCGYVGLVSGVCLAHWGHNVTCIDSDITRIEALRAGRIPIYEPGLDELLAGCARKKQIRFTADLPGAVRDSRCIIIAVGTPADEETGHADLRQVMACARDIALAMEAGRSYVVVLKSTVPPGTCDRVERTMHSLRPDVEVSVASNPEFLREGSAIADFQQPDRVVVGAEDATALAAMETMYLPLTRSGTRMIITDRKSSELIKYASNAFLATKIAFVNQLADLCEQIGADIGDVAKGMGSDKRIGDRFLEPGPGYGGSCFPKDTMALLQAARRHGVDLSIVGETISSNDRRKSALAERIRSALGGSLRGKTIGAFGLAFKANTDDLRDSPALAIVRALAAAGAHVRACDPSIRPGSKAAREAEIVANPYECARGCDALVFLTEWQTYGDLDLKRLAAATSGRHLFDFRRMIDPEAAAAAGFSVHRLGAKDRPVAGTAESSGDIAHAPRFDLRPNAASTFPAKARFALSKMQSVETRPWGGSGETAKAKPEPQIELR